MAKYKRTVVGSVVKAKEKGKADYIKVSADVVLTKGQFLNLESKQFQKESLEAAIASGKLKAEFADKARERVEAIPDFVRFQIVAVQKED